MGGNRRLDVLVGGIGALSDGELDRHLKRLAAMGSRRKAEQYKIILRDDGHRCVRHGVLDSKPIDGVAAFTRRKPPARGKVQDHDALPAFRAQVRVWANGEEIPGTPAYTCGPPRDWTVVWVVDVVPQRRGHRGRPRLR
ncbi:hypothetical protein [Nocardia abscessus]|uniref:hypothetical protein n=1 Tax=Nocardia abscessus TaxID=120957 RepID=UPI002B4B050D|nr:hypothetical protein [Nocardia abscessus]